MRHNITGETGRGQDFWGQKISIQKEYFIVVPKIILNVGLIAKTYADG